MSDRDLDRDDPLEPRAPRIDAGRQVERIVEAAEQAAAQIRAEAEVEASRYLEDYKRRVDRVFAERMRVTGTLAEQSERVKVQYEKFVSALDGAMRKVGEVTGNGYGKTPEPAREDRREEPRRTPDLADELRPPARPSRVEDPVEEESRSWRPWRDGGSRRDATAHAFPGRQDDEPEPRGEKSGRRAPLRSPRREPEEITAGGYEPRKSSEGARLLAMQMAAAGSSRGEIEARLRDNFGIKDAQLLLDEIGVD